MFSYVNVPYVVQRALNNMLSKTHFLFSSVVLMDFASSSSISLASLASDVIEIYFGRDDDDDDE